MGCMETCPLCRRQCDLFHEENQDLSTIKHGCSQGHQLQSFGGSKEFQDDYALLFTCNELRDGDLVIHKGNEIKWKQFKVENFPNWSFDSSGLGVRENRLKNVKLWNLVGLNFCLLFYDIEGIIIKFKRAENKSQFGNAMVHYIIMLDDSGSMSGTYWNQLMDSFNNFMDILQSNQNLLETSRISVLNHNESSMIYFQEQIPSKNLTSQIKYRSGGNDFNPPLYDAHKLCNQNSSQYDIFVLYFMSDGVSAFPDEGIKRIVEDKAIIDRIDFHSIAFGGADKALLQRIASSFPGGQLSDAPNAQALKETFVKLVPNIKE